MLIENKDHKPLIEMTDEEIVAIIRNAHLAEVCVNNRKEWMHDIGGRPMTPYGVYRLIPKYTPITVDWSVLDDSIQWIAADKYGSIWAGSCKNNICATKSGHWSVAFGNLYIINNIIKSLNRGTIPWDQSLIKRPDGV